MAYPIEFLYYFYSCKNENWAFANIPFFFFIVVFFFPNLLNGNIDNTFKAESMHTLLTDFTFKDNFKAFYKLTRLTDGSSLPYSIIVK